eukprot:2955778-Rhodomonas_salina.3
MQLRFRLHEKKPLLEAPTNLIFELDQLDLLGAREGNTILFDKHPKDHCRSSVWLLVNAHALNPRLLLDRSQEVGPVLGRPRFPGRGRRDDALVVHGHIHPGVDPAANSELQTADAPRLQRQPHCLHVEASRRRSRAAFQPKQLSFVTDPAVNLTVWAGPRLPFPILQSQLCDNSPSPAVGCNVHHVLGQRADGDDCTKALVQAPRVRNRFEGPAIQVDHNRQRDECGQAQALVDAQWKYQCARARLYCLHLDFLGLRIPAAPNAQLCLVSHERQGRAAVQRISTKVTQNG